MYFTEKKNIVLNDNPQVADVQATYYSFLNDQSDMFINLAS